MRIAFEELGVTIDGQSWGSFSGYADVEPDGSIPAIVLQDKDPVKTAGKLNWVHRAIEIGPGSGADTVLYHLLLSSIRRRYADLISDYYYEVRRRPTTSEMEAV